MIRKIFHIVLLIFIPLGLLVLLGLTSTHNQRTPIGELSVDVDTSCGNHFIDPASIKEMIAAQYVVLKGQQMEEGLLVGVKQLIESNPYVRRAAIYRNITGDIQVNIKQRSPLIRVTNSSGQGYYIDREGKTLPLSSHFTSRVMVAAGYITSGYDPSVDLAAIKPEKQIGAAESRQRNLYRLATYIDSDSFWKALIDQVYVTQAGDFELIPMNGAHVIELGGPEQMEEKFEKLKVFYAQGLSRVGWHYYHRINLKYDNQIVCSK